jgi:hypothetical protein
MLVGWYLRRAIPWMALLGCCGGAVVMAIVLDRWPATSLVLLPVLVGCCAAAAAFIFDERPLEVVAVTPRGASWRRTARLAVALLPLLLWTLVVLARPGDLPLVRGSWFLVGGAAIVATAGTAALASRHAVPSPGSTLAGGVVMTLVGPVIVCGFLDWDSLYPLGDFPARVLVVWLIVATAGGLACFTALRPGVRR